MSQQNLEKLHLGKEVVAGSQSAFPVDMPTQELFFNIKQTFKRAYDKVGLINATDYINQHSRMHQNMA